MTDLVVPMRRALSPACPARYLALGLLALQRISLRLLFPILISLLWPGQGLAAQGPSARLPTITTTRAAHQLPIDQAARGYPVHLRGTVTFYDLYLDAVGTPVLFVSDETGSIYVALASRPLVPLTAGDLIEVDGVSSAGLFAPIVDLARVRVIGRSAMPLRAPRVMAGDLMSGSYDGQWVEVQGLVQAVRVSGTHVVLDLLIGNSVVTAVTSRQQDEDYSHLIDAGILLRAIDSPNFNDQRQLTGAHLLFPNFDSFKVVDAGPADPFQLPVEPIHDVLRFTPVKGFQHRVHVRGAVTLLWPGRMICIADGVNSLCGQTGETTPMRVGERADVVGFPMIGAFTPNLVQAQYSSTGDPVPVAAHAVTAKQALEGDFDARLVTIKGKVIDNSRSGSDRILTLSSGDSIFTSIEPLVPGNVTPFEIGSLVAVTGICSVQAAGSGSGAGEGFSIPQAFRILERSSSDIVLLQKPPWWNVERSLRVLAGALSMIAFAMATIVLLRLRIKHQTATIRAQLVETKALKEAAEFAAMHDSLTGIYNRKAIFSALSRELDLAARSGTVTGVLMLDIDHFKKINDTHGHAAGDYVIREAVRRILETIRSSDLVGRYGGEEFLVVLPICERDKVEICAERIRASIADEPITFDGTTIWVTASLGAVATNYPIEGHGKQDAIIRADRALYESKNKGRNRVSFCDLYTLPPAPVTQRL